MVLPAEGWTFLVTRLPLGRRCSVRSFGFGSGPKHEPSSGALRPLVLGMPQRTGTKPRSNGGPNSVQAGRNEDRTRSSRSFPRTKTFGVSGGGLGTSESGPLVHLAPATNPKNQQIGDIGEIGPNTQVSGLCRINPGRSLGSGIDQSPGSCEGLGSRTQVRQVSQRGPGLVEVLFWEVLISENLGCWSGHSSSHGASKPRPSTRLE